MMIGVLRARLTCDVKAVLWLSKSNRSPYRTITRVTIHRPSHTHSSRGLALSSQPAHTHTDHDHFHFILSHDHIFSRGVPNKTLFARASRASTSRTGRRHALYVLLSLQRVAVRADVVDHRRDERRLPASLAEKAAMYSPAYGLSGSESRPGTMRPFDAERRPKMPIIARRPLLISARSAFSLRSGVRFFVKPKGSHRSSGTGWGSGP